MSQAIISTAPGGIFMLPFTYTTFSSSDWMGVSTDALFCNAEHYILPFNCNLIGLSYASGTNNSTIIMEVHKASTTATSSTRLGQWTINAHRVGFSSNFAPQALVAGDRIMMYALTNGATTPADLNCGLYFNVTSVGSANTGYNFAGNTSRTASGGISVTV